MFSLFRHSSKINKAKIRNALFHEGEGDQSFQIAILEEIDLENVLFTSSTKEGGVMIDGCKYCGSVDIQIIPRPDTPHAGEYRCIECGKHNGWAKKEKNVGKRGKSSNHSPESLNILVCECCRRSFKRLGDNETLTIHHKDRNPENDSPQNILVLCTFCHVLTHQIEVYFNDHLRSRYELYNHVKELISKLPLKSDQYEEEIKKLSNLLDL